VAEDVVRARRFELVDDAGETRAVLDTGHDREEHVGLTLFDTEGKARASLGVMPDGFASLSLGDEDGREVIKITASAVVGESVSSDSVVALKDKSGQTRVQLGVSQEGEAAIHLTNSQGASLVQVFVDSDGTAKFSLQEQTGSGGVSMQGGPEGRGLAIGDDTDTARVGLLHVGGKPTLVLSDAEGRPRAILQLSAEGVPTLALLDEEGSPIR